MQTSSSRPSISYPMAETPCLRAGLGALPDRRISRSIDRHRSDDRTVRRCQDPAGATCQRPDRVPVDDEHDDRRDRRLRHRARDLRRPLDGGGDRERPAAPARGPPDCRVSTREGRARVRPRRDRRRSAGCWPARRSTCASCPRRPGGGRVPARGLRRDPRRSRRARPRPTARSPARSAGRGRGARDVGAALARNPFPIIVPCHRVLARERQARRVLRAGRPRDEAPDARARGRAGLRPAGAVRLVARRPDARRTAPPANRPNGPRSPRPSRSRPRGRRWPGREAPCPWGRSPCRSTWRRVGSPGAHRAHSRTINPAENAPT